MALTTASAVAAQILTQVLNKVDGGTGPGTCKIYTGAAPGADNAASGTLLATIALPKPSFVVSGHTMTLQGVPLSGTVSNASTAQTPGYFRLTDSAGAVADEGSISEGGSLELNLPAGTTVVNGNTIQITGYAETQP